MELRDYIRIIGKHLSVFIIVAILGALSAFLFTLRQPTTYTASTTFTVNKASSLKQTQATYYLYDNYYNVQSAGLFSQIVTTWFSSPSLVKEIYQKSGIEVPNVSQNKLSKTFKAVRDEPATINVKISGTNKDELDSLINSASTVLQEKTNELNNGDTVYEIAKFIPVISQNTPSLPINTLVGLLAGIILGAVIALGIDYFKNSSK